MATTIGGYQRRQDEWTLQANLAQAELAQIDSQIIAANDRLNTAQSELSVQQAQIGNAQAVSNFLTTKYTSAQLYNWMVSQLITVYTQAYQLAFSLALGAQTAYHYELCRPMEQFIQFAYWDSQHKGLTAGESLLFDLRRMEAQYLANNDRELELTKHVSLALTQPMSLVDLLQVGFCAITLDEDLFERDHPGHYFRRLRSVAVTIPCISGPYTGVNATLTLGSSVVRTVEPSTGYQMWSWGQSNPDSDPTVTASQTPAASPIIATSSGQNDAGLFDVNLHDERWLPFEGQGAVSNWNLELDPRDNNFDVSTITDVVLHIRYTARAGTGQAARIVRDALTAKTEKARSILVSVRHTFGDAWYALFNPVPTAAEQTLTLPLANAVFPFSNLGTEGVTIDALTFNFCLSVPAAGNTMTANFAVAGAALPSLTLTPAQGTSSDGSAINVLTGSSSPNLPSPQTFTLTIPVANVPKGPNGLATPDGTRLDPSKIEDILLVVNYSIA